MHNIEIYTLWGERKGFEGSYPELMVAWTEHQIDENAEGFDKACADEAASWGNDLASTRLVILKVDIEEVAALFDPATVPATVTKGDTE